MKTLKAISCLLLALLLLSSCTTGDDRQSETTEDTGEAGITESGSEAYYLDTLPKNVISDYDEFRIYTITNNQPDSAKGDIVSLALAKRDAEMMEYYNEDVEIIYKADLSQDVTVAVQSLENEAASGLPAHHAFITSGGVLAKVAAKGWLEDLNEIDYLNLNSSWWNQSLNANCTIKNNLYFAVGPVSQYYYHMPLVLAFNKDKLAALKNMSETELYGIVSDGSWTLDKMAVICKDVYTDMNDNGADEDDIFAISATPFLLFGLFASSGGHFSTVTETGGISVDCCGTETALNIINKIITTFNKSYTWFGETGLKYTQQIPATCDQFTNNKALFLYTSLGNVNDRLSVSDISYGIIPTPKSSLSSDYITCAYADVNSFVSIQKGFSDEEKAFAGMMIESYCFLSEEIVTPVKFQKILKYQLALDEDTKEMMDLLFETLYFDHNLMFNFGESRTLISNTIRNNDQNSAYISSFKSKEGDIQKEIADLLGNS